MKNNKEKYNNHSNTNSESVTNFPFQFDTNNKKIHKNAVMPCG